MPLVVGHLVVGQVETKHAGLRNTAAAKQMRQIQVKHAVKFVKNISQTKHGLSRN